MLTAVALTSYLFKVCKAKMSTGEMLPIKDGIQKIKAKAFEWILKANKIQTLKTDKTDRIEYVLKITARLLLKYLEIAAVMVPANAEITAIKDKTNAAELTSK